MRLEVIPVEGVPEVEPGDDLGALIIAALRERRHHIHDGDVLVVAQKVVSKAEGRLRRLDEVVVSSHAAEVATRVLGDPRMVQVVLDESVRVVREERVLIVETRQGFVCANGGVDHSNVPGDVVTLLPEDSDVSAAGLRARIRELTGAAPAVVVADTFGRPWRNGIQNVALGLAGMAALIDYRGQPDDWGKEMKATVVAVADELAAAAELVMGKTARVPAAVVRGYHAEGPAGSGRDLLMPAELDLFR
jgi:coenzyme F420-0:L-glutamate ligase/coenzyme F420-1:gamma-L-glutamate ligase